MKSVYTEMLVDEICEVIANSDQSLAEICREHDFPAPRTIRKWLVTRLQPKNQHNGL